MNVLVPALYWTCVLISVGVYSRAEWLNTRVFHLGRQGGPPGACTSLLSDSSVYRILAKAGHVLSLSFQDFSGCGVFSGSISHLRFLDD